MHGGIMQNLFISVWSVSHLICLLLLAGFIFVFARFSHVLTVSSNIRAVNWLEFDKALVALGIAHCLFYLIVPNFVNSVEPLLPILAGNYLHGAPVYSDWSAGQTIIGSNYGPYAFLTQVPVLLWHPSIFASKLVGIFCGIGGLVLTFLAVVRRTRSRETALATCALMVALLSSELHYWFWNRPDSILIAVASAGVLLFQRAGQPARLIGLGLIAGIAVNLKLFGFLYLMPLVFASVSNERFRFGLIIPVAFSGLLFAVALTLPFMIGITSLGAYIANLIMMPAVGYDCGGALEALFYGAAILSLPLLIARANGAINREDRMMLNTLSVCTVLLAVVAGNPGGGPPYMMPLVPCALYLSARLFGNGSLKEPRMMAPMRLVMCAVVISAAPFWAYSWFQMAKGIPGFREEHAKAKELRGFFQSFPGSEMGHNLGLEAERDEFFRVEKAFLGFVTRFDYVNYADQRAAGLTPSTIYPLLENCTIPYWILTRRGGRFLGKDFSGNTLLDDGALQRFHANYNMTVQGRFYEIWQCSKRG